MVRANRAGIWFVTNDKTNQHAEVSWDSDGQPLSQAFDDVYFSRADGLAETRHVFLQHNQLPERFARLAPNGHFVIGETGFGSGLNFLATWQLWHQHAPASAHLDFISVEKYPLKAADLARALALWPELSTFAEPLLAAYPTAPVAGFHRLEFAGGRIRLTLIIDEATHGLEQLLASDHPQWRSSGVTVDAWFLDGFAPAKNPEMWRPELFAAVADLSGPGTSAATFSAAGVVKRGLQQAGFAITKVPGYGRKREMLSAVRPETDTVLPLEERSTGKKYAAPWDLPRNRMPKQRQAVVIGGGLAGCHSARALAERGFEVTVLERQAQLAAGASGNPQGVLYAKLSYESSPLGEFNLAALLYAQRHYQAFWQAGAQYGQACGVLQLAYSPAEQRLQTQLCERLGDYESLLAPVDAQSASEIADMPLSVGGLYFPRAGWLSPRHVCAHLTDHPNIRAITDAQVLKLVYDADSDECRNETCDQDQAEVWQLQLEDGSSLQASVVVMANAYDAQRFEQTRDQPLKAIRGQVSYLPATRASEPLRTVLCADGYLAPAHHGVHCAGASFNLGATHSEVTEADHQSNLHKLHHLCAALHWDDVGTLEGRVGFRCATRDYLPVVGPVPRREQFLEDYAPLRKDAHADLPIAGDYWPGLYLNVGHGSRGLAYTPLCAQLLATQICAEPRPVSRNLSRALHPARFLIRDLIRSRV